MIYHKFWSFLISLVVITSFFSCAEQNFINKTALHQSVLQGDEVEASDPMGSAVVMIAHNFQASQVTNTKFVKAEFFGLCSGVVLHPEIILTAAHCVDKNLSKTRVIHTTSIRKNLDENSQIFKIKNIIYPKEYTEYKFKDSTLKTLASKFDVLKNDIALIKLDRPLVKIKHINHLSQIFKKNKFPFVDTTVNQPFEGVVTGFGKTTLNNNYNLQDANLFINGRLEKALISFQAESYNDQFIILNQKNSSGVCTGDSGGPLFKMNENNTFELKGLAVGIIKSEVEDPNNMFNECYGKSIFLNLNFYSNWIYHNFYKLLFSE